MEMWMLMAAILSFFALFNRVTFADIPCTMGGNNRCVRIRNNCPSPIWPAISMQVGSLPPTYDAGHKDYHFPNNVTYLQVWARTECIKLVDGSLDCMTGSCGPSLHCDGGHNATLPVTMAEIWPNPIGFEKYDVTLFNGFNIPVKVTPTFTDLLPFPGIGMCSTVGSCKPDIANATFCPTELTFIPPPVK